ncbi:MAG: ATP-binding cassette domain-containing protein, partial [Rhizobacter sp.]
MNLLEVDNLTVEFGPEDAPFKAVDDVSLAIDAGEVVGIVGESGSGKSVTALALMNLVDYPGRVDAKRLIFEGRDLLAASAEQRRRLAGRGMAMI